MSGGWALGRGFTDFAAEWRDVMIDSWFLKRCPESRGLFMTSDRDFFISDTLDPLDKLRATDPKFQSILTCILL